MLTKKELDKRFQEEMRLELKATQESFALSRRIAKQLRAEYLSEKQSDKRRSLATSPMIRDRIKKYGQSKKHGGQSQKAVRPQKSKFPR